MYIFHNFSLYDNGYYLKNLAVQVKRKFYMRYNLENPVKFDLSFIGSRHANNSFYLYGDITISTILID